MTKRYVIVPLFHLLHPIGHKSVESYPVRLFLPRTRGGYVKKKKFEKAEVRKLLCVTLNF